MKPGQDLVVAGFVGLEGVRQIARAREKELCEWFSIEYVRQMQTCSNVVLDQNPEYWKGLGATEWEMAGEGGIYTALWNLSGAYMAGFQIDLYQLPVKQETIELCERFDLDPYRLYCGNCMVLATDNGGHMVEALAQEGIVSSWIGIVKQGAAREICYGQVRRFMDRPREDELYKILKKEIQ